MNTMDDNEEYNYYFEGEKDSTISHLAIIESGANRRCNLYNGI